MAALGSPINASNCIQTYERLEVGSKTDFSRSYDTLQNAQIIDISKGISEYSKVIEDIPGYETLISEREQDKSYDILKKSQIGDNSQTQSGESIARRQEEPILEINTICIGHESNKSNHSYGRHLYDMENIDVEQERSYAYASFPSNSQNKKEKNDKTEKYPTRKEIASFLIGFVLGGVMLAIIVFAALRNQNQDEDNKCNGNSIFPGNHAGVVIIKP
ncbi:uncharacterized protein LOC134726957 [Mytilus trossulus]|uniref:uncharacterized protein LOC134726957 n=1 Tax=Mytilus trossulus TaxID=6551 RepID=UPI0030077C05